MHPLWVVAFVAISFIAILFIALYFRANVILIRPIDCAASTGLYGVRPSATGDILNTCSGRACTFAVDNLEQAISYCDADTNRCQAFIYNSNSGSMSYVKYSTEPPRSSTYNLYQRYVM